MWYPLKHWLHEPYVQVYVACKMTGLPKDKMREKALAVCQILQDHGITVWHPVIAEKIPKSKKILLDRTDKEMAPIWKDDRKGVKWAHVVLNTAADVYSAGAWRETGKSRYGRWKPTPGVWVDREVPFIARQEDDGYYSTIEDAADDIVERWGTRAKRIAWRWPIWKEHFIKSNIEKIIEFWR